MSEYQSYTAEQPVSALGVDARATFITRTYMHLVGAVLAFVAIEVALFQTGAIAEVSAKLTERWWLVMGGFMVVNWGASHFAHRVKSLPVQYALLGLVVAVEAALFAPLLYIANTMSTGSYGDSGNIITSAAVVTLGLFAALTVVVFMTRKDFSFLGAILRFAGFGALLMIVGGFIFGFQLGFFFSVALAALACGSILYDTSNVLHHYPEDRYVAASLELFTSLGMLFWYILRIFMSDRD